MDEFLDWILEGYAGGDFTEEDIDLGIEERTFAYEVFMDFWKDDKKATGEMAQEAFEKAKQRINRKTKHGKPNT